MNTKHPETLREIFDGIGRVKVPCVKVPSYQRAYAWEEKQLKEFVSDLLEITSAEGREYYYGNFVLELTPDGYANIIDGQQRLTTLVLFLLVCQSLDTARPEYRYINFFETVDYDAPAFQKARQFIQDNENWDAKALESILDESNATLSIKRIFFALDYFRKAFDAKSGPALNKADIHRYTYVLLNANISCHIAQNKAVATQIFELHNSRGIKLTTLEKVKAKLMKAAYMCGESSADSEAAVAKIQKHFAEIYRYEELLSAATFRGNLSLEGLLFHHLRMVDDGTKGTTSAGASFREPSGNGKREDVILAYIDKRLRQGNVPSYATALAEKFEQSVKFVSSLLPGLDESNRLLGDVMILDRGLSIEFFLLLHFKGFDESLANRRTIRLWELLLFTRDFHGKYYNLQYRDNFEQLFQELSAAQTEEQVPALLSRYVQTGFRQERMDERSLPVTVSRFLQNHKERILKDALSFGFGRKIAYLLYKHALAEQADVDDLRAAIKDGLSVEHILPRSWAWEWINEKPGSVSESGEAFNKSIESVINGIGNLLIVSESENSSLSNTHPCDKEYRIAGGTYQEHNASRHEWKNPENWTSLIRSRGESVYSFLEEFTKLPEAAGVEAEA